MTRPLLLSLLLLLTLAAACKRGEPEHEDHPDAHAEEEKKGEDHGHEEDEERVHVDPSMLRDLRLTVAPVQVRPGGEGVTALGELSVNEGAYAEVGSPLPARIVALHASPGEQVKAGAALAQLQAPELGRARAELQAAAARAHAARAAATRKRTLATERVVAEREAQEAEAQAAAAEAELAAAKATLAALGADAVGGAKGSSVFTLRSPVDGLVIERRGRVGQMAEPSQTLFEVGDLSELWLTVHAFERDAVRVHPGAEARVSLAALPGKAFSAKVTRVGARVDAQSRTVPVRLELPNPDGQLKPGMSATAFIPLGEKDETLMAVPLMALQQVEGGWSVFLPTQEPGAFERRAVGRGRTLGNEVEVLSGLKAGEKVVVEGAFLLKAEAEKAAGGGESHAH
ncbi:MAG TPA: efflux RND transporter periplasmic adaptor subunit [Aggregicoccus sp.]|nr:efflux RND transporter periplasmic adaptor subunit [Aggregicoccus sp.]